MRDEQHPAVARGAIAAHGKPAVVAARGGGGDGDESSGASAESADRKGLSNRR
jgi:hypothetical protein